MPASAAVPETETGAATTMVASYTPAVDRAEASICGVTQSML